jgi:hypothetical protein
MDTRPLRSLATAVAVAVPVLVLAAACGSDDAAGAPEDASRAEFCETFLAEPDDFGSDDADAAADAAHEYADSLAEVGTPGVSDEARRGFELYVDLLADVDASDVEDLADQEPSDVFSGDDLEAFEAFADVTADCGPGEF